MSTPAVPAMPAAPAAPAAPAVPVSTPAAPAAPATSAPPAAAPAAPAPPAAAAAPVAAAEPKNTDFAGNRDGQVAFLAAHRKWEAEQPAKPAPAPVPVAPEIAEARAAAAQLGAQPGDQPRPADGTQPAPAEAAAPTPQEFDEFLNARPERRAALEADPELKGKVFGMARRLAAAEEVLNLVPTKADAEFMRQHATEMVGLKTASMRLAVNPESAPQVLEMLDQQFAVVDKDGKPVVDAQGRPTFAADRRPFIDAVVNRELTGLKTRWSGEMETLKNKLASGVYPNEAARNLDQQRFDRLEYAQMAAEILPMMMSGEYFEPEPPEIPADASNEFRTWAEQERARLQAVKDDLDGKKQGAGREQQAQASKQFSATVRSDMGASAGRIIGEQLRSLVDSGAYIPEFYLQQKYVDPATGKETNTAEIAARIFMQFESDLMRPGSRTLMDIAQHELLPQNEQTRAMRADWYRTRAVEMIPGLVAKEAARIEKLVKVDQDKLAERDRVRRQAAQPEPVTAGSGLPQGASERQLMEQAETLAKKDPGFAAASPGDKQARILTQLHRLRPAR